MRLLMISILLRSALLTTPSWSQTPIHVPLPDINMPVRRLGLGKH